MTQGLGLKMITMRTNAIRENEQKNLDAQYDTPCHQSGDANRGKLVDGLFDRWSDVVWEIGVP